MGLDDRGSRLSVRPGRRDLQNRGIGRPMKAGKEAIVGVMAALDYRNSQDLAVWSAEQDRKVQMIVSRLANIPGLALSVEPDANGCPFSRARLTLDPQTCGHTAATLRDAVANGDPTIVLRDHHVDEGYVNIDSNEMTDKEIEVTCRRIRNVLTNP